MMIASSVGNIPPKKDPLVRCLRLVHLHLFCSSLSFTNTILTTEPSQKFLQVKYTKNNCPVNRHLVGKCIFIGNCWCWNCWSSQQLVSTSCAPIQPIHTHAYASLDFSKHDKVEDNTEYPVGCALYGFLVMPPLRRKCWRQQKIESYSQFLIHESAQKKSRVTLLMVLGTILRNIWCSGVGVSKSLLESAFASNE